MDHCFLTRRHISSSIIPNSLRGSEVSVPATRVICPTRCLWITAQIRFRQLWTSCRENDALLSRNKQLIQDPKEKGFAGTAVETPETHDGTAWHYSLIHFVELLFSEH